MNRRWSARPYRDGDEKGIFELWKAVYPGREYDWVRWLRWWNWAYKDNPAGQGRMWLAEHDGKIIGQYAIIPMELKVGDNIILGSLSLDTMTHPDCRHQKIFETLANKVYADAAKDGIHVVYGFPNNFSYPGFIRKLRWFDVGTVQVMLKPLNWRNAVGLKVRGKFLQEVMAIGASLVFNKMLFRTQRPPTMEGLIIKQIAFFDGRFDELWSKVFIQNKIMVARSSSYLNWRYGTPDTDYSIFAAEKAGEICGYLVLGHRMQGSVKASHIFDLVAQSEEAMRCLVSKSIEDCQQNNVDLLIYRLMAGKAYYRVLRRNGFISLSFIKGRFCAYSSLSIPKALFKDPKNWFVQIGDSDMV